MATGGVIGCVQGLHTVHRGFLNFIICPPHPVDDRRSEGLRPKKEKGTLGKCSSKGSLIVGNLVVDDWMEVGDCCKASKEHADKGAVALHMSFASCACPCHCG